MGLLATILMVVTFSTTVTDTTSLYKTIEYSLKNSSEMRIVSKEYQIADTNVKKAWTTLLPFVNAYYMYKRNPEVSMPMTMVIPVNNGQSFQIEKKDIIVQHEENNTYRINISENLFNGSMIPAINLAYNARELIKEKGRLTKENIIKVVSRLYFQYVYLNDFLKMLNEEQDVLNRIYSKTEDEIRLGLQPEWSKLRINLQLQKNKKAILEVQNGIKSIKRELKVFTGKTIYPENVNFTPKINELKEFNKDSDSLIKLNRLNYNNRKLMYKVTLGRFLPSLSLVFDYSKQENQSAFSNKENWYLMLRVNWNILSGTERFFSLQEAGLKEEIAEIKLRNSELKETNKYQKIIENLKKLKEEVKLAEDMVKFAEKNFELTNESYKLGKSDIIAFLDSRNNLLGAKLQLLNSKNNLILEYINYKLINGECDQLLRELKNE